MTGGRSSDGGSEPQGTPPSRPTGESPQRKRSLSRANSTPLFYPEDPATPPTTLQRLKSLVATWLLYYLVVVPTMWLTARVSRWTSKHYRKRQEHRCETILQSTEDARTWITTATQLDNLRGLATWSQSVPDPSESRTGKPYCDPESLVREAAFINTLIATGNQRAMGEYIRTHLHRDAHGCIAPELFCYYTGTKVYVEQYYASVKRLIEAFARSTASSDGVDASPSPDVSVLLDLDGTPIDLTEYKRSGSSSVFTQSLLRWANENPDQGRMTIRTKLRLLQATAQSFGRTALLLSGGASLGMYHVGVVRAIWFERLMPRILSGSSAGSIIAAILCTRSDEDVEAMFADELKLKNVCFSAFEFIEDVEHNVNVKVRRLMRSGAFMDVSQLVAMLRENCGDMTFLEAYRLTGRILNVSVAADREGDKSMLLNYINSPHVVIWSAVSASCAMPGLFTAVPLMQMDPDARRIVPFLEGQLWFDGSVANDLPKRQLAELFNCNLFLVSQTNPHVIPFQKSNLRKVHKGRSSLVKSLWFVGGREVYYWLMKMWRFGLLPKTGFAEVPYLMASQEYGGDVTIFPIGSVWSAIPDYVNLTTNPTDEHLIYVMSQGLRRTWPYVNQIRCITEVERTIERELLSMAVALASQDRRMDQCPLRRSASFLLASSFALGLSKE